MWWGQTPALDLGAELDSSDVNMLLISQGDCRHVLQTLAKRYRHPNCTKLNLYVYEPRLDNVARSLLLLSLGLDKELGLGRKARLFMDLYGNTLVRPSTWQYLHETAARLVNVVTNANYAQKILPSVSLDTLKYKDRDQLERIFRHWGLGSDGLDVLGAWEQRVRALLGTRYDSRLGVYDWDLHMRYRPYGADTITAQEYKLFREKGVAFLQDDTDPCIPNVTLTSFAPGAKSPAIGYFGDIVAGPYPAFGLASEQKELLQKCNGQIRKSATEIFLWNVEQMLNELEHGAPYSPTGDLEDGQVVVRRDTGDQLQQRPLDRRPSAQAESYSSIPTPDTEIIFLPPTALKDFPAKPPFQGLFDLVTVPQHLVSQLPPQWVALCKPECLVVVESAKYVLGLGKDGLAKAKVEVDESMKNLGGEPLGSFDYKKDDFIRYQLRA